MVMSRLQLGVYLHRKSKRASWKLILFYNASSNASSNANITTSVTPATRPTNQTIQRITICHSRKARKEEVCALIEGEFSARWRAVTQAIWYVKILGVTPAWGPPIDTGCQAVWSCTMLQEASLRGFCERPENKGIIEREQKKQAMRMLQVKQLQDARQFQHKVLLMDLTFAERKDH